MGRLATVSTGLFGTSGVFQYPWSDMLRQEHDTLSDDDIAGSLHYAERIDGTTKGSGDGPFFSARFDSEALSARASIDQSTVPVRRIGGMYRVNLSPSYPSLGFSLFSSRRVTRNGRPCLLVGSVTYDKDGNFYTSDIGRMKKPLSPITLPSYTGMSYDPYIRPPWDLTKDPSAALAWVMDHPDWDVLDRGRYSYSLWTSLADYIPAVRKECPIDEIPLKYGEYQFYIGHAHELFNGTSLANRFAPISGVSAGGFASAYQESYDKLPRLASNTIANLIEIGKTILSLSQGIDLSDLKNIKKLTKEAWLSYRYSYNTTLSDLEDLESNLDRWYSLADQLNITSYGSYTDRIGRKYHCALCTEPAIAVGSLDKRLNLRLSLENAWDMVPYSFIIDWFTGISSLLHGIDTWLDGDIATAKCWYSLTHQYEVEGGSVSVFFRFGGNPPSLPVWQWDFSHKSATWASRITDAWALIVQ